MNLTFNKLFVVTGVVATLGIGACSSSTTSTSTSTSDGGTAGADGSTDNDGAASAGKDGSASTDGATSGHDASLDGATSADAKADTSTANDAGVDPCHNAPFFGDYCGESFQAQFSIPGGEAGYLYTCGAIPGDPDHAQTTAKVKCPTGCFVAPAGSNDHCK